MKILVTGGAGFIGSHFIEYLLEKDPDCQIVNVDKLTYAGRLDNLKTVARQKRYQFVRADICDARKVDSIVKQCQAIIHFAAETHVDRSIKDAGVFVRTNVLGTHVLLEAGLRHKIKRFLHVSTDEVYGSRKKGFFKESDPLDPSSPYSASKAASDLLVLAYAKTYKMPVVITRSSNNFGPRQYPEKVIPLFISNLLKNKKVPLYADGGNIRDWIYVKDHCAAIELVFRRGLQGEAYNIAAGQYMTNLQLTKKILKLMDKPLSMINYVTDRLGHDFRYAIDTTKLNKLGFRPQYSFEQGLALTLEAYRANAR